MRRLVLKHERCARIAMDCLSKVAASGCPMGDVDMQRSGHVRVRRDGSDEVNDRDHGIHA